MPDRETTVLEVGVEASLTKVTGMDKVSKAVQQAADKLSIDPRSMKPLEQSAERAAKMFYDTIGEARAVGLEKDANKLEARMRDIGDKLVQDTQKMAEIQARLQEDIGGDERKALTDKLRMIKVDAEAREKSLKKETEGINKIIERRTDALGDIEKFTKMSGRDKLQAGLGLAEGFAEGLGKLDPSDFKGMAQGLLGGMQKSGRMLEGLGGKMGAGATGGTAAAAKGIAAAGAGAAAFAGVAAALVGVVAAIAAIFLKADEHIKGMNKTLLEGSGVADRYLRQTGGGLADLDTTLKSARKSAQQMSVEWGIQQTEVLEIVAGANQAGLTYAEMTERLSESGNQLAAFNALTKTAVIQSKMLGVSTQEISEATAQWTHDFGGGLEMVDSSFAAITSGAMESGIQTKRFFGMVQNATAGLALYNGRVDETAGLIAKLADSLGEEGAAGFVQGLQKGFSSEGYQERFKRLALMDSGTRKEIFELEARGTGEAFGKAIETLPETMQGEIDNAFGSAFEGLGPVWEGIKMGDPAALNMLRQLGASDTRELVAKVTNADAASGRQLQTLIDLTNGLSSDTGEQTKALDALGPGGTLAMVVDSANAVIGQDLDKMNWVQLEQFSQLSGYSGEQLNELQRMYQEQRGQYELQKKAAKDRGEEMGTFTEFLMSNDTLSEKMAELGDPLTIQEQLTKEVIDNTVSMNSWLKILVDQQMVKLIEVVNDIWTSLPFKKKAGGEGPSREQQVITARIDRQIEKERDRIAEAEKEQMAIHQIRASGGPADEEGLQKAKDKAQAAEAEIAALEEKRGEVQHLSAWGRSGRQLTQMSAELGLATEGDFSEENLKEQRRLTQQMVERSEMTPEEIAAEEEALQKRQLEEQAAEAKKTQEQIDLGTKATTEGSDTVEEAVVKSQKSRTEDMANALELVEARKIAKAAGFKGNEAEAVAMGLVLGKEEVEGAVRTRLSSRMGEGALSEPQIALAQESGLLHDFLYRGTARGGTVTPIDRADEFLGAKAGGPVDKALSGGTSGTVQINIHGGDTQKIYQTVKRAMRESGVRPPAGGR